MEPTVSSHPDFGTYDDHTKPHDSATVAQISLFLVWLFAVGLWLVYLPKQLGSVLGSTPTNGEKNDQEVAKMENGTSQETEGEKKTETEEKAPVKSVSQAPPAPTKEEFLQSIVIFGLIMMMFFLYDYRKILPLEERVYNKDVFLFLVFLLFAVSLIFTVKPCQDKILNRDQTEEWKGWMQVMFVWYHYFAAKEWYNWIRVYIAAYVWMTGFGNFSFFWIRKDYSLWRVLKMLFRLNFLVIFVCLTMKNEFILYYIPAMHTYWFLSVYAFMGICSSWNTHRWKMALKFGLYALFNIVIFEIPGVCTAIFRPFTFLLAFHDGQHDPIHEWEFRLRLDHWACFIGMLCAYNYPYFESLMAWCERKTPDKRSTLVRHGVKVVMSAGAVIAFLIWHQTILYKEKYSYNALHPYFSFIPILSYIILRNIIPKTRAYHLHLLAWLGKITLETYLSQLHIYLQSNAKHLLGYLPDYPLLNFSLATIIYIPISYKLFYLTTDFSAYLLPKDMKVVAKNFIILCVVFSVSTLVAFGLHTAL